MDRAKTVSQTAPQRPPMRVHDFWTRFQNKSLWLIVLYQVLGTLIVCGALFSVGILEINIFFGIIVFAMMVTSIAVNVLLFEIITKPLQDMTAALSQVAGEPSPTPPPNPNAGEYSKNGFKQVLQAIYELSSERSNRATQPAQSANQLVESALDNAMSGFIILNPDGDIAYSNKKAPVRTTNTGKKEIELIFDDEKDSLTAWLKQCSKNAVSAQKSWSRISNKLPGEEGRRLFDINASYHKDSRAETVITLLDRNSDYLPEEEDLDFISFAAHELRGPITVIRGYLDVLGDELDEKLEGDQKVLLGRLVVSANRLSSYVNNILNASRYDRRHLKVHLNEDSLYSIYDTIKDDMELRAQSQNRYLSVDINKDLPTIAADRGSLSEVLSNLIDNAIKYSNEGGLVHVSASRYNDGVKLDIVDRGIGMPGNVVSNLFHKFYRSHRSRETVAGTGIGLYISKAIVESHGGEISVKSVEGEGSTFSIVLPTYASVADKLDKDGGLNKSMINQGSGWIKNHAMYRG